jgi:hypothetical protein
MHVPRLFRPGLAAWPLAILITVAGCGGGGVATAPVPAPGTTAPALPASGTFAATNSVALAAVPQTNGALAVALPAAGPYSGTMSIPAPSGGVAGTTFALTLASSTDAFGGVPTLTSAARIAQARHTDALTGHAVLFYLALASSAEYDAANAPGFVINGPAGLPAANYYAAFYSPLQSSLGWQLDFEGPATVSGSTLTFAAPNPATPIQLHPFVLYTLAVYAASSSAPAPTPAPAASPIAPPAPPAAFTLSAPSLSLLATGATATATITDPTGYTGAYGAASSNSAVATAAVSGSTVTVTAVAAGTATITVNDAQARTAGIAVTVTTTNVPVH